MAAVAVNAFFRRNTRKKAPDSPGLDVKRGTDQKDIDNWVPRMNE